MTITTLDATLIHLYKAARRNVGLVNQQTVGEMKAHIAGLSPRQIAAHARRGLVEARLNLIYANFYLEAFTGRKEAYTFMGPLFEALGNCRAHLDYISPPEQPAPATQPEQPTQASPTP